ncbi:MAG TPA: dienelactone hydrolase family protein, partial [Polyangia bacterium]
AHGSGSGRASPRNRAVARKLNEHGWATLLVDLLSDQEQALDAESGRYRFDITLLASRLVAVTDWIAGQPRLRDLPLAYFGASTGAAAALLAAAARPERVAAVVSRGGRIDLAGAAVHLVRAATLLVVGSEDETVLELNERALAELRCDKQLRVVEGAGHLFEEPGALEAVTQLALPWLAQHSSPPGVEARV